MQTVFEKHHYINPKADIGQSLYTVSTCRQRRLRGVE
jgi:hypothetical protein